MIDQYNPSGDTHRATPPMEMEKITIRAFRAIEDPARCEEFVRQHSRVLEDIGVFNVLKPDTGWCADPSVVVLVAEHPLLGMVAGIRLHKATYHDQLPMQRSLEGLDPAIGPILSALLPKGNAEIAGLWNAHRFAGRGVPMLLMEACVAVASRIDVRTLVTFIAEYVAPYAAKSGFTPLSSLENEGVFQYPVAGIHTHAMVLDDVLTIPTAELRDRHRILSLRLRPHQSRLECPKRAEMDVAYELLEPFAIEVNLSAA